MSDEATKTRLTGRLTAVGSFLLRLLLRLLTGGSRLPPVTRNDSGSALTIPAADVVVDFGTSASVLATCRRHPSGQISPSVLVGEQPYSSELALDCHSHVLAVGSDAMAFSKRRGSVLKTSLKRHIELVSREDKADPDLIENLRDIVEQYVRSLIMSSPSSGLSDVNRNSYIVISVPNSFNPKAVSLLRQGVVSALRHRLSIDDSKVRLVKEGEAVAYLYSHSASFSGQLTLAGEAVQWHDLRTEAPPAKAPRHGRIAVLDIGGGTTDLTVVDIAPDEEGRPVSTVVMNGGVPIGGMDIDRILFGALLTESPSAFWLREGGGFKPGKRELAIAGIRGVRAIKEEHPHAFGLGDTATREMVWDDLFFKLGKDVATVHQSPAKIAVAAGPRVGALVELSVGGLFGLLGSLDSLGQAVPVSAVLLTGRGSMLSAVRNRVIAECERIGAIPLTLSKPAHLKLAVAAGCMVIPPTAFHGDRLPALTLGHELLGGDSDGSRFKISAGCPVSTDCVTTFRVRPPTPRHLESRYIWWQTRVLLNGSATALATGDEARVIAFASQVASDYGAQSALGLGRQVAFHTVRAVGGQAKPDELYLVWDPSVDSYLTVENSVLKAVPLVVRPDFIHPLTRLPIGFLYD